MKISIVLGVLAISIMAGGSIAFGQEITINSNKQSFSAGDLIELTGKITGGTQPITLEVKDPSGQTVLIRTIQADDTGDFSLKFKLPTTASSGTYGITATSVVNGETITKTTSISQSAQKNTGSGGNGCLIATATYGSEFSPHVQMLREIRDNVLFSTGSGTAFMTGFNDFYYSFSPAVSDLERQSPIVRGVVLVAITPMVSTLSILNYVDINSEQAMLGYGIGLIMLNVGMYFVIPAFLINKLKQQR